MTYKLTVDPGGSGERVVEASKLSQLRFTKRQTAIGDWMVHAPFDLSWADNLGDEIHLEKGSEFLFRGYLRDVQNSERYQASGGQASPSEFAKLEGDSIAFDLTRSQTSRSPTNITVADEIQNVWALTSFSASVIAPSANTTTTDESVQEADTDAEFNGITSNIADTDPLAVQNGNIELLQSCFTQEAENFDANNGTLSTGDTSYSEGAGEQWGDVGDWAEWSLSNNYTIPNDQFEWWVREESTGSDPPGIDFYLDDELLRQDTSVISGTGLAWSNYITTTKKPSSDIEPGTHTLRIEVGSSGTDSWRLDVLAPLDARFSYTFDNTVDSDNGNLDGPELFPSQVELILDRAATTWSVNQATLSTSWDDTSNNQRLQLRLPPDGSWGPTDGSEDNTTSITDFGFGSDVGTAVQGRARFSRYGSRDNTTPKTGFNGQKLQSWEITIDGDDIPVYTDPDPIEGSHYDILREMHEDGRMQFTIPHEKNAKSAESYPIGGKVQSEPDWTIRDRDKTDTLEAGYTNSVTVRGARDDDGNRITRSVTDTSEINDVGEEHREFQRPDKDTQTGVDRTARQLLREGVSKRDTIGTLSVVAIDLNAGYSYPFPWKDGISDNVVVDEVIYEVRAGELRGRLKGDFRTRELATFLGNQQRDLRGTQLSF